MRQDIGADVFSHLSPAFNISLQVQLLCRPNAPIQCHPAHYFGIYKVAHPASHFPDSTVWLLPVGAYMLNQQAQHRPQRPFKFFPIALKAALPAEQVNAIQHFAENIQLFLTRRVIANSYRLGFCVATQVRQFSLRQIGLATDTIHNLQVFSV